MRRNWSVRQCWYHVKPSARASQSGPQRRASAHHSAAPSSFRRATKPAMERLEISCHRSGRPDEASDAHRMLLDMRRQFDRLGRLTVVPGQDGWAAARVDDQRTVLAAHCALADTSVAFRDQGSSRQLSHCIIMTAGELKDWRTAMDWVEHGYFVRPGRLMRVLMDLPFFVKHPDRRHCR